MSRSEDAMTCPDARELFSAALDDALGADERERLDVHLTGCADCRGERERFERTVSLLRGAEPIRAPAGFVDRVLAAVRPEPWWRRLARRLFTPWAVKLPLEAAAVALVAITAVYLYREMPEQRHVVQQGTPVQEREGRSEPSQAVAARPESRSPEPGTQPPATESGERFRAYDSTSGAPAALRPPPESAPVPTIPETTPLPSPTAPGSPIAPPPPAAAPPEQTFSRAERPPPNAREVESKKREGPGDSREDTKARAEPSPDSSSPSLTSPGRANPLPPVPSASAPRPRSETVPDMPRRPIGVEGRLSGIAPASGRAHVAALVARLGGAIVAERSEADASVIDILLPRARYDELARELAQLGRWSASDLPADTDPVRILVRLVD